MSFTGMGAEVIFARNIYLNSALAVLYAAGPGVYSASGAPAAGLGAIGSLYMSSGGSLYFKQAAGWKRIDNWVS
jgi:hypothetical protein